MVSVRVLMPSPLAHHCLLWSPGRRRGYPPESRRTVHGVWEGRVAYVAHLQNGQALVELWLPAEILQATPLVHEAVAKPFYPSTHAAVLTDVFTIDVFIVGVNGPVEKGDRVLAWSAVDDVRG